MSLFRRTFFKLSIKNLFLLSFIWLMAGFTIGTEILLGPTRWTVNLSRQMDWSKSLEDLVIKLVIGLFVLGSLIISMLLENQLEPGGESTSSGFHPWQESLQPGASKEACNSLLSPLLNGLGYSLDFLLSPLPRFSYP